MNKFIATLIIDTWIEIKSKENIFKLYYLHDLYTWYIHKFPRKCSLVFNVTAYPVQVIVNIDERGLHKIFEREIGRWTLTKK